MGHHVAPWDMGSPMRHDEAQWDTMGSPTGHYGVSHVAPWGLSRDIMGYHGVSHVAPWDTMGSRTRRHGISDGVP